MFYHLYNEEIYPEVLTPGLIIMHNHQLDTRIDWHLKNREFIHSKTILTDHQLIFNFAVSFTQNVCGLVLDSLSGTCSVKNLSQRKKLHPNGWSPPDAIASHVLKKLIRKKSSKLLSLFRRRKITVVTNMDRRKIFSFCTIFIVNYR